MLFSGIAVYIIVLLIPVGAAVIALAARLRLRQRDMAEDFDDADESFTDVPLLLKPRTVGAVSARPAVQRVAPTVPAVPAMSAAVRPAPVFAAASTSLEADSAVQLLPGRLVPLSPEVHQEIRFIKQPGVDRFTLGRSSGPAYSHIQLSAPTASRMHAYMRIAEGGWQIGNLSETNPVLVNGVPVLSGEHLLANGDVIELGEVAFTFRDR